MLVRTETEFVLERLTIDCCVRPCVPLSPSLPSSPRSGVSVGMRWFSILCSIHAMNVIVLESGGVF